MTSKIEGVRGSVQWHWVLWYIHLYLLGIYGVYMLVFHAKWPTVFLAIGLMYAGTLGITLGAHRLWAHQTYKTSWYVRLAFMLMHTITGAGSIYDWVLEHRLHHKYYGTENDPYNHTKGFLYSHLIANTMTKSANYEDIAKSIDMRDLELDGFVWVQKKFYVPLFLIVGLLLPINAPAEYWDESIGATVFVMGFLRLVVLLNVSWLVNSGRHVWGLKPNEKFPSDDNTVFFLNKSYWLNYHYLLPWDWKSGEFGTYEEGCTNSVLRIMQILGIARHMKSISTQSVREALYRAISSKKSVVDVLSDLEKIAEYESATELLQYHH